MMIVGVPKLVAGGCSSLKLVVPMEQAVVAVEIATVGLVLVL